MNHAPNQWQAACEKALLDFTGQDALRLWGMGHGRDTPPLPPFDYRHEHTLSVVQLARWLAPLAVADEDVLVCAAWLHDCRKRLGTDGPDRHAQDAAEAVGGILGDTDFPPSKIPAVRHAILNHVGLSLARPLEPLETACLWDADKLSKLGVAGITHFVGIAPAFGQMTTKGILARGEAWLGLARGIVRSMNTAPARREAAHRYEFLRLFYERLKNEISDRS